MKNVHFHKKGIFELTHVAHHQMKSTTPNTQPISTRSPHPHRPLSPHRSNCTLLIRTQMSDSAHSSPPRSASPEPYGPFPLIELRLHFDPAVVYRRAALGLLPHVQDPECSSAMGLSALKSSRDVVFAGADTVTNAGGYRLCRATRELDSGARYYWEIDFAGSGHIRAGIATRAADTEAPVGCDAEGYSVRDLGGKYHCGAREPSAGFSAGDTIGFGFYCGSGGYTLRLFVNGADCGVLFGGIDAGRRWLPAVSTYGGASASARFRRPFRYEPGAEWAAAGDCPCAAASELFTAERLIEVMRTTLSPYDEHEREYLAAIDTALIPANQMQC